LSQPREVPQAKADRPADRCRTKNLTEGSGQVRQESRYEYARAIQARYRRAGRSEKGRILEEFCAATGYARKYAIGLLGRQDLVGRVRARRAMPTRRYGSAEVALLRGCWELSDRLCGKRLGPFLPELLDRLAGCGALPEEVTAAVVERVAQMSPATIDRLLRSAKAGWPQRGRGTTKPGTLLKQQVPIRTYADWDDARPGFLEADLVAHCGASGAGEFLFTVSAVDVATGWMALQGVRNKSELAVFAALEQLRAELPFPLLGLDADNGGEFINRNLLAYCQAERITLTRSRPYRKNDNCHIEQKNWSVVRRLVGYGRFEGNALGRLNALYGLARDYVNFLQPVRKLVDKTRDGPKVTKRYDQAATPYRRLVATGSLVPDVATALADRSAGLDPVRLKLAIDDAQQALYERAVRSDLPVRHRCGAGQIFR
jgi:hypothetical protein